MTHDLQVTRGSGCGKETIMDFFGDLLWVFVMPPQRTNMTHLAKLLGFFGIYEDVRAPM